MKELRERIEKLCEERHMSFSAVERACGLSKNTICRWGVNSPPGDKLKIVADYFGVSVDYLLSGKDGKTKEYPDDVIELLPILNSLSTEELEAVKRMAEMIAGKGDQKK